jgi:hypothetical protein
LKIQKIQKSAPPTVKVARKIGHITKQNRGVAFSHDSFASFGRGGQKVHNAARRRQFGQLFLFSAEYYTHLEKREKLLK